MVPCDGVDWRSHVMLHFQTPALAYLINQMLRHKFFTESSNYSTLLPREFTGVHFRYSAILHKYLISVL
jgi:hypothetical protein